MKIGFVGNMNNNHFAFARYLIDLNYQVKLILLDEPDHFKPIADAYDFDFLKYTFQSNWHSYDFAYDENLPEVIKKDIEGLDFLIGCGHAPAYLHKVNRSLDIFLPYGFDFYKAPFIYEDKLSLTEKIKRKLVYQLNAGCKCGRSERQIIKSSFQREGILKTKKIGAFSIHKTPELIDFIEQKELGKKFIQLPIPMLYHPQYEGSDYISKSGYIDFFKTIRSQFDILIFHHAGHKYDLKSNDTLFKGVAKFIHNHPDVKLGVITTEYGYDVDKTKQIIREEGIQNNVIWTPKMLRKDLMAGISLADIGAFEFKASYITGGVLFEYLCSGIPVMQYRDDKLHEGLHEELYPIMNVKTPEDVLESLEKFRLNPEKYKKLGKEGKDWFVKNIIKDPIDQYVSIIENNN